VLDQPEMLIETLRGDAIVLILTHDHALDYRLLRRLLDETELSSIGMIGSQTKSNRFRARLRRDGIPEEEDARWRCPVGLPEVGGKLPMEVAISIAAEVLSQSLPLDGGEMVGASWKSVQAVLGKP
jgi:xanthine dehydrogenase accessory factor